MMRTSTLIGVRPADAVELALLQHAQQAGLRLRRHVADLVEEQRAAVGLLEAAGARSVRAGEGAASRGRTARSRSGRAESPRMLMRDERPAARAGRSRAARAPPAPCRCRTRR
jgi:hypothetical protein